MGGITVIGSLPPPYGGAAKNTAIIANAIEQRGCRVTRLDTAVKGSVLHSRGIRYHLGRMVVFFHNMKRLVGCKLAYIVPDGGLGLFYTLGYVLHLRLWRAQYFFHHRNYSHINSPTFVMRAILFLSQKTSTHIFLDAEMGRAFDAAYSTVTNKRILTNAALNDVPETAARINSKLDSDPIVIGYLSNLTNEKGFHHVVKTFERLASKSPRFRFVLAGEPVSPIEVQQLNQVMNVLGDRLDYRGAVFGKDKCQFFNAIDIFLFPTRFKQEAQPNVVYEAMAPGCYVIATARACIPEMLRGVPSSVVAEDEQLEDNLVLQVLAAADCDDWPKRSIEIQAAYTRILNDSRSSYEMFFTELAAAGKACEQSSAEQLPHQ